MNEQQIAVARMRALDPSLFMIQQALFLMLNCRGMQDRPGFRRANLRTQTYDTRRQNQNQPNGQSPTECNARHRTHLLNERDECVERAEINAITFSGCRERADSSRGAMMTTFSNVPFSIFRTRCRKLPKNRNLKIMLATG
jgi:hypothetical protein